MEELHIVLLICLDVVWYRNWEFEIKKPFANRMRRLKTYVDGYEILTLTQKITHYIQMCQMGRD